MQICADIGERPPRQGRLDETHDQNDAGEGIGQDGGIIGDEAAAVGCVPASLASLGIDDELEDEACCSEREHAAEREEDVAPPEQVAEHAAHGLPEKLPQNVA